MQRGPGQKLRIEEVMVAAPGAFQVRLRIVCSSLCHSDLTFWRMKSLPAIFPRILGHEACGVVESVGEGVEEVREGDLVIPSFVGHCGACADCHSDHANVCAIGFDPAAGGLPRATPSPFSSADDGAAIHTFLGVSSFAQYTVVDVSQITLVGPAIPPEKACLLSCGVSTGVGAAWKVAAVERGSSVAIFGLGAVGLAVVEGARLRGASTIIGVDLNPEKKDIGKKLGLTAFINPKEIGNRSLSEVIREMTHGGADYCFECIGLASLVTEAFASSRKGWGKTVVLGVEMNGEPFSIDSAEMLQGRTITGSLFGGIKAKTDIPILVKQYLNKELRLDEFITHELRFQEINKAFDLLERGKCIRCIIWMDR
ncbi:alcohol dehydrogenase-like 7 isoform X2 [Wolffia australiana]